MSPAYPKACDSGLQVELGAFAYARRRGSGLLLRNVSFAAPPGQITVVMGRSGCGKTTLLRLLAGIQADATLRIRLEDAELRPPDRRVGLVFQDYRLFPWKTVEDNILCSAHAARDGPGTTDELLEEFRLTKLRKEWPKTLSGGEQARVALARCLVQGPKVLLLDEVFRSLDLRTRVGLFESVARVTQKHSLVTIAVTHDVDEARRTADHVVVLEGSPTTVGRIIHRKDSDGGTIEKDLATLLMNNE